MMRSRFYGMFKNVSTPFLCTIFLCTLYLLFVPCFVDAATSCGIDSPSILNLKDIACASRDLRMAVRRDSVLRRISSANAFAYRKQSDEIRSVEKLTWYDQSVITKIEETHKKYQEEGRKEYILEITAYPSSIEENSCPERTINFTPPSKTVQFPDYPVVKGKPPRYFQLGKYKKKLIMCERTGMSYKKRLEVFCGKAVTKCSFMNCSKRNAYRACKKDLLPSCSHPKVGTISNQDMCTSLDDFLDFFKDLLGSNKSLAEKYCTDGCSYYPKIIQGVHKNEEYCFNDNYIIVHCGPERGDSKYNFNIREIKNLCSNFDFPGCVVRL